MQQMRERERGSDSGPLAISLFIWTQMDSSLWSATQHEYLIHHYVVMFIICNTEPLNKLCLLLPLCDFSATAGRVKL